MRRKIKNIFLFVIAILKIKMVDYGTSGRIPVTDIYRLHDNFINIPVQSITCYLRNVKPKNDQFTLANIADFVKCIDEYSIFFCKLHPFDEMVSKLWHLPFLFFFYLGII